MDVNLKDLPSVALISKETLPKCCGIYFVLNEDEILYIGKSVNLLQRWKAHHKLEMIKELENSDNFRIAWLEFEDQTILDETEIALIMHFKPRLNGIRLNLKNKKDDGSEQLRIKKEFAKKLRNEAEELDMSIPEALYYIMNTYFNIFKKINISATLPMSENIARTTKTPHKQQTVTYEEEQPNEEKTYTILMDD